MKPNSQEQPGVTSEPTGQRRWMFLFLTAFALVIVIGLLRAPRHREPGASGNSTLTDMSAAATGVEWVGPGHRIRPRANPAPTPAAEEIVADKVTQFARSRREIARAIARRAQKEVPAEVEKFFEAVESGQWDEIKTQWDALAKRSGQYEHSESAPELKLFWPAVLDAYGVAEQAHEWPAQQLLDYGNAILDSLRPGMVYVGGTDNGRWIPELLNETSGAEPHVIVTQNALADGRYVDFMNTLYGDRLATLDGEDSKAAFQEYMSDAQKRLEHDQQFPDERKQVRPGETIQMTDGHVQVSGQVAVMAINEKLLQTLMRKNPDLSFAMQESFPMSGTYPNALPLGPIMELGAADGQNTFTAERAAQSLDYWRNLAQQTLSDPEVSGSPPALKSYSHDAVAAANLLAAHNFNTEAEQGYRLAAQLWPENPESIGGLADLLARGGRDTEARQVLEDFTRQHPGQRQDLERTSAAWRLLAPAQTENR